MIKKKNSGIIVINILESYFYHFIQEFSHCEILQFRVCKFNLRKKKSFIFQEYKLEIIQDVFFSHSANQIRQTCRGKKILSCFPTAELANGFFCYSKIESRRLAWSSDVARQFSVSTERITD